MKMEERDTVLKKTVSKRTSPFEVSIKLLLSVCDEEPAKEIFASVKA